MPERLRTITMLKRITLSMGMAALGMGALLAVAAAAPQPGATLSRGDRTFMMHAATGGLMEVKLGQLASERAANADVKAFGTRMVEDHGKANNELMQLATSKGVTPPKEMDAKGKAMAAQLGKLSGAAFDKAYMRHMVEDHVKDVAAFDNETNHGTDADVKAWAAKTVPTLREHLTMARDTAQKVGVTVGTAHAAHGTAK